MILLTVKCWRSCCRRYVWSTGRRRCKVQRVFFADPGLAIQDEERYAGHPRIWCRRMSLPIRAASPNSHCEYVAIDTLAVLRAGETGFVPNYSAAGAKSQDRSEEIIGSKVLLEIYKQYNEDWSANCFVLCSQRHVPTSLA